MQNRLHLYCCCYFNRQFFLLLQCTVICWCWDIYQNIRGIILSLPSASDILRYILSCQASATYDLPINLQYIYKRVSPLIHSCIIHTCIRIKDHISTHRGYMHDGNMHPGYMHHGYMHYGYMHHGYMHHGYKHHECLKDKVKQARRA